MGVIAILVLELVSGLVFVEGSSTCPSPSEVSERLAPLLPADRVSDSPDRVRLAPAGDGLNVELLSSAGRRLAARRIPAGAPCGDLAGAVAVVVATWEAEMHPGLAGSLSLPESPPPPRPQPPGRRLAWEAGAGLLASYDGVAPTGGASAEASLGVDRLAARLALVAELPREAPLGPGRVAWSRPALSLGARYRFAAGSLQVDALAELVAGLLIVGGKGLDVPRQELDFDPGLGAGVRVALRRGRLAVYLGISLRGWLRRQTAFIGGGEPSFDLPRIDGALSLGLTAGN